MSSLTSLTKFLTVLALGVAVVAPVPQTAAQSTVPGTHFELFPNPKFVSCLGVPGGATPKAQVTVIPGQLNDTLVIKAENIRPGLGFDLFTIERTNLLADHSVDPAFANKFGLSWYQSDLQANAQGRIQATIKTVLLNEIFGFDSDLSNPAPINTFNLGFWFNNPNDATVDGCTFDVTHPTPFNGEHNAGPLAMSSAPDAVTNLGPLCTTPNTDNQPATCNP